MIKQRPPEAIERLRILSIAEAAISSIIYAELAYGATKSGCPEQNLAALSGFVVPLEIIPFDHLTAYHCGRIRAYLENQDQVIGIRDMLIAAHAPSLSLTLVTDNSREFSRVPGLVYEN